MKADSVELYFYGAETLTYLPYLQGLQCANGLSWQCPSEEPTFTLNPYTRHLQKTQYVSVLH